MTTALDSPLVAEEAFEPGKASAYLVKPIKHQLLLKELRRFNLI